MFQLSQIWESEYLTGYCFGYCLVTATNSRNVTFMWIDTSRVFTSHLNSLFVDSLSYIGTADEFPELFI